MAQNKPEFVNNVETRQQCMFEISHLRELRRAKRVQLLAMASGTNLTKTPRTQKPKGNRELSVFFFIRRLCRTKEHYILFPCSSADPKENKRRRNEGEATKTILQIARSAE